MIVPTTSKRNSGTYHGSKKHQTESVKPFEVNLIIPILYHTDNRWLTMTCLSKKKSQKCDLCWVEILHHQTETLFPALWLFYCIFCWFIAFQRISCWVFVDVSTTIRVNSPYLEPMVLSVEVSQVNKPQLPAVDTTVYPQLRLSYWYFSLFF